MKLKLKLSLKIITVLQKCLTFSNYSTKSKHYDVSHKLLIEKMQDKTAKIEAKKCIHFW